MFLLTQARWVLNVECPRIWLRGTLMCPVALCSSALDNVISVQHTRSVSHLGSWMEMAEEVF